MNPEELQITAFEIILSSGNTGTVVHEAFDAMREGSYDLAEQELQEPDDEPLKAHQAQANLLRKYVGDKEIKTEAIIVHTQDHLITMVTLREVTLEMPELYKKINQLRGDK